MAKTKTTTDRYYYWVPSGDIQVWEQSGCYTDEDGDRVSEDIAYHVDTICAQEFERTHHRKPTAVDFENADSSSGCLLVGIREDIFDLGV